MDNWYTTDEIKIIDMLRGNKEVLMKLEQSYHKRDEKLWGSMNSVEIVKHIRKRIKECNED